MKFKALCGFTRAARFPVVLAAIAISSLVAVLPARAEILHESATFVAAGSVSSSTGVPSGVFINNPFVTQFLGSRFSVDEEVEVDMIGGHIYGAPLSPTAGFCTELAPIFGVIVKLSSPGAVPSGSPFTPGEVVASTLFTPPCGSVLTGDFLVPLSATLQPGDYALIFGSNEFGATGNGVMPNINTPDSGSYFFGNGTQWFNGGVNKVRFVVTGTVSITAVSIDIKPFSFPNSINLCSNGAVQARCKNLRWEREGRHKCGPRSCRPRLPHRH